MIRDILSNKESPIILVNIFQFLYLLTLMIALSNVIYNERSTPLGDLSSFFN
jgi:hypothetical protein